MKGLSELVRLASGVSRGLAGQIKSIQVLATDGHYLGVALRFGLFLYE